MFAGKCGSMTCSALADLRHESEWYGHNLLSVGLEDTLSKETSEIESRKYNFVTEAQNSFTVFGSSQGISRPTSTGTTSTNANFDTTIRNEYWQQKKLIGNTNFQTQTFLLSNKTSVPVLCPKKLVNFEMPPQNCVKNPENAVPFSSSEIKKTFVDLCNKTVEQNCKNRSSLKSGSVEIKVEVDPHLYDYETGDGEPWSSSHVKKPHNNTDITLLPNTCTERNWQKNCDRPNRKETKYLSGNSSELNIPVPILNIPGETVPVECNNINDCFEGELNEEQKSGGSQEESENESDDDSTSSVGSEFCVNSSHIEESNEKCRAQNCNSQEQLDTQLSEFYKFVCDKCIEKQTFSNFELFKQHCRDLHQIEGQVSCCGESMLGRHQLVKHMLEHKHSYRCAECQTVFAKKSEWKNHLKKHLSKLDIGPFRCPHCEKQFSSKYGLANHMNLHLPEGERPYKCQYCNKGFGAKHAMTKHERTHLPDEERLSYVCDICGKRFGYASTLDGHQRHVHQNERPFICHICAKTFPIKGALTYHLTTHEVQDRVQCTQCGIWLKNEKILRIHRKCHQGELFTCPHCDKVSSTRNNLRMHMKRHSDARPHGCPLCPRAFKTPRDLKTHMVQHTGQKPYSCPYCPKTFASPSNFYAHRKMKHKVSYDGLPTSSTLQYQY